MTASAAEGLRAPAPPGERDEQDHGGGPDGRSLEAAPAGRPDIRPAGAASRKRGRTTTVLFCLLAVQIAWLAVLAYGAYALVG